MTRGTKLTTFGLLAVLAGASVAPAMADSWGGGNLQNNKNNARNLAIGSAAIAAYGLLNHNSVATVLGAAGAVIGGSQYEHDRQIQSQDNGRYYYRDYGNRGNGNGGYDRDGYDHNGYNRDGYNRDGFNRDGFNRDGFNRDGRHWNGGGQNYNNRSYDNRNYGQNYDNRSGGYQNSGNQDRDWNNDGQNSGDRDWDRGSR